MVIYILIIIQYSGNIKYCYFYLYLDNISNYQTLIQEIIIVMTNNFYNKIFFLL